jgi:predicted dehydrogenase
MPAPVTAIVVGAGHRALLYASYARIRPEELKIVGVADPDPDRRRRAADQFGLAADQCFPSAAALADRERLADAIINGTGDFDHVATTVPLLDRGYHVLLEKPFAVSESEMDRLVAAASRNRREVVICHVLRHSPFYASVRQTLEDGILGDILNIQATEHVSYHHMSTSYVRGKRNRLAVSAPMLLAKSCHDVDLLVWMMGGQAPFRVGSFGSRMFFREDKAPQGAGTRCLTDCPIETDCLYSARKLYLDHPTRWKFYVWDSLPGGPDASLEEKREALATTSPFGRCIWKCDNDVVDHQTVAIEFEGGATATLNMIGGCAKGSRKLHIIGTKGEIFGNFEDGRYGVRLVDPRPGREYDERVVDVKITGDMTGAQGGHGGGDLRLMADFCRLLRGERPSLSTTTLADSVNGHRVCFRADLAMREGRIVSLAPRSTSAPPVTSAPSKTHGIPP